MPKLELGIILRLEGAPLIVGTVEDLGVMRQALGSAIEVAERRAGCSQHADQRARALRRLMESVGGGGVPSRFM